MSEKGNQASEGPVQVLPTDTFNPTVRRYDVARSCLRCHTRKVRCDKAVPCLTCVRAKVPCRYPGSERAKRRSHKPAATDVLPQPETLEHHADAINHADSSTSHQAVASPQKGPPRQPQSNSLVQPKHGLNGPADSGQSGGLLLKEGASTRYVNEPTFSRVVEKDGELQSAIDTPESIPSTEKHPSAIGFDGLISSPGTSGDIFSLLPSRWRATQLWQMYLNNVDCLVKVLHVPSMQPRVFAAINGPKDAPHDVIALLFSIYFSAVTSLRSPEVQIILGQDRPAALKTFQRGLEMSLHVGSFLDTPTIVSLQAMAIYLMCRRNSNSGRSGWILNGLLLRAAQAIGLHRDGERFNLSPLECEIRRRLWWQILGSDGRVAEDHALSAGPMGGYDGFADTKLPTHIDDRDISAATTTSPAVQQRWTEMTHFLVASEMYQTFQQLNRILLQDGDDKTERLENLLSAFKARIKEQYLQYCDSNIPIQRCSLLLGQLLMGKFEVFIHQQHLSGLNAEESASRATDETLALACNSITLGLELKTDEIFSNFQWLLSTFVDYHLLTYILWHLCVRPGAAGADEAWVVVDRLFDLVNMEGGSTLGSKWNVLKKLRLKAADIRNTIQAQLSARNIAAAANSSNPPPVGVEVNFLPDDQGIFDVAGLDPMFAHDMFWDLEALYFPEWNENMSGG